ncbi:MAG: hypothetical protein NZ455_07415 [Bacteroidia bacterium]|nr:hypothetical protein [Bacteroidia bacterium]MDW8345907.1 hypothetical protein [Bacteroidia bacterium]
MRHAEGVRQHGAKPLAHTQPIAQGVGGWGVAPLARSTPTRSAAKGHAQKYNLNYQTLNNYYYRS